MRKVIVTEFISLDGVVEAPGGEADYPHTGWTFDIEQDPSVYEFKAEELEPAETLLLGRTTYEGFSAAWPERDGDFADKFNSMEKVVVSTTLENPSWNNTSVVRSVEEFAKLREGDGGPIMLQGSATLAKSLYKADLVDTYHLLVWPVILGSGLRLFPDDAPDKHKLTLTETRTYKNGIELRILERQR
jgi:dihydrofolate reductase